MEGWIKLHRKVLDNPIVCKDSDHIAVWMYILLNATHKEYPVVFSGNKIILQPGQLITGRKVIAEKFKISESKVQRILKVFESEQQIEQQNGNKNRLISILSWSEYQSSEQQDEQLLNNKRTTTEQQLNTNKNVRTKEGEEQKKERKKKDTYPELFEEFWNTYPRRVEKSNAVIKWNAQINKGVDPQQIITSAYNYMIYVSAEGTETKYMKHPKTFLNGDTWKEFLNPVLTEIAPRKSYQSKAERAEEQRNALKQSILGGISNEDFNQGRSRVDVTPNTNGFPQLRLEC